MEMAEEWHLPPWVIVEDLSAYWFHWWRLRREELGEYQRRKARRMKLRQRRNAKL